MSHAHLHNPANYGKAFAIGIGLNTIYFIADFFYGISENSSALLADAGHNASDAFSLFLAWATIWAAKKRPRGDYTMMENSVKNQVMYDGLDLGLRFEDYVRDSYDPSLFALRIAYGFKLN